MVLSFPAIRSNLNSNAVGPFSSLSSLMKISVHSGILFLAISVATASAVDNDDSFKRAPVVQPTETNPFVPSLPGQIVKPLPGQFVDPLPGQVVKALPGQIVQPLPGQVVRSLRGYGDRALRGQIVLSVPRPPTPPPAKLVMR